MAAMSAPTKDDLAARVAELEAINEKLTAALESKPTGPEPPHMDGESAVDQLADTQNLLERTEGALAIIRKHAMERSVVEVQVIVEACAAQGLDGDKLNRLAVGV